MGATGTKLYDDDLACDVKGVYIDALKCGKSNEEANEAVLKKFKEYLDDTEEGPVFWFAFADIQWEYGRLIPYVKEKALEFLDKSGDLEHWAEQGEKYLAEWKKTREQLRDKINSEMPKEKKVRKYQIYECPWKVGDLFAYQFHTEYSEEKGFYGKYIVFQKVGEQSWWPKHIIPIVHVFDWVGEEMPSLETIQNCDLIKLTNHPDYENTIPEKYRNGHNIAIITQKAKQVPEEYLTYLGNNIELISKFQSSKYPDDWAWDSMRQYSVKFEESVISKYMLWHK